MTGPTIAPEVARIYDYCASSMSRWGYFWHSKMNSTNTLVLTPADDLEGAELWGAQELSRFSMWFEAEGLRNTIGGDNPESGISPSRF